MKNSFKINASKKILKYFEVVRISINELFAYPVNFIARLMVHGLRILMLGVVYTYVYQSGGKTDINGFTALNAVWSLALVQLIYQCSRNTFAQVKEEITSGQIETKINKPYSFIIFDFVESVGQAPIRFIGFSFVTVVLLAIFFGIPDFSSIQLLGLIILFILGLILNTLIMQLIALSSFWIENPDPVYWITSKLSWIVNGTFVPLAIMPIVFRNISDIFPLSAPFFIGRIFEITDVSVLIKFVVVNLVWIIIFAVSVNFVYKKGITKISINGG